MPLTDWFHTRRQLHDEVADTHALNDRLLLELDDLHDKYSGLKSRLDAARIEANALAVELDTARRDLGNARTELEAVKTIPLYTQMQNALRHAAELERRLHDMQQQSLNRDVPVS